MAFTYNLATDIGRIRLLIQDTIEAAPLFQDAEIQAFLDLNDGSLLLGASFACRALATLLASGTKIETIGDYSLDNEAAYKAYMELADRLEEQEFQTPAFATVEENLSQFNELIMIRNFILRTGGGV